MELISDIHCLFPTRATVWISVLFLCWYTIVSTVFRWYAVVAMLWCWSAVVMMQLLPCVEGISVETWSVSLPPVPRSQRDDYHLLSRKQQVILVRLRTGHNRLNSHMPFKLKLAPSPTCPCGQEEQTTEHVLQRCPLHKATREDVWPVSTSLTTKLYGRKQELEKTTSFISRATLIV